MRTLLLGCVVCALGLLAACAVDVTGAPCDTDDNCPTGQWCDQSVCRIGTSPGSGSDGGSSGCIDQDGDGYGEGEGCLGLDCDDADSMVQTSGSRHCYSGAAETRGVGECKDGHQTCSAGVWSTCEGEVLPSARETCGDSKDNDCNGTVDDQLACALDTYVCTTCEGASDTNPGSQVYPLKTIAKGIAQAQLLSKPTVFVANQDGQTAAVYREELTVVEGVSLQGRWNPKTLPWTHDSAERTVIQNTAPDGMKVKAGVTRATRVEGFEIRGTGAMGLTGESVGLAMTNASPTLMDLKIVGTADDAPAANNSTGLKISGFFGTAAPLLQGTDSAPLIVTGGKANKSATGIDVSFGKFEAKFLQVSGGIAGNSAVGLSLSNANGSSLSSSTVTGGTAAICSAVSATKDVAGLVLETSSFVGCQANGATAPGIGVGIAFDDCSMSTLQAPVIRNNAIVSGGVGSTKAALGGQSLMAGISASRNCPVEITGNQTVSSGIAADGETISLATGINCSWKSPSGTGSDSACVIQDNDAILAGDATTTNAYGILCDGSCQSDSIGCAGSCATIARNKSIVARGKSVVHVYVGFSSPDIARNGIGLGSPGACSQTGVGLLSEGSAPNVINNFISSGPCPYEATYLQRNRSRTGDAEFASPNLHSNTLVAPGGPGTQSSAVVALDVPRDGSNNPSEATPVGPLGSFRNNIFARGPALSGEVFAELHASCDPRNLENNDFFDAASNGDSLYLDENTAPAKTTSAQINQLDVRNVMNLAVDPQFVLPIEDLHLQPTSPMRGAGTALFAPPADIDGDPRPNPTGSKPDIGADEIAN